MSAPAKRMPSSRASRNVPSAATKSLSAAISASERQNGSTYAGRLNAEKTADEAFAQVGASGHDVRVPERHVRQVAREWLRNGSNSFGESDWRGFEPWYAIPAGRSDDQGAAENRKSDADRVRPGASPGANMASDSTA